MRGTSLEALNFEYPYVPDGDGGEDDDEIIAMLDADHEERNGDETRTAESENHG